MNQVSSAIYEATVDFGTPGLVGTLGMAVLDNVGGIAVARSTDNVVEITPGVYAKSGNIAPAALGQYTIRWDDGSLDVGHVAIEELVVTAPIPSPPPAIDYATTDVCALWASADDAYDCCPALADTDETTIEWALIQASDILYHLSGHKYPGLCTATVRPCAEHTGCWCRPGFDCANDCSCVRLSKIRLAGYPVQEILNVVIDGVTLASSEYRLDRRRELVRLADTEGRRQTWPTCQRLDLAEGEGTFFINYMYGLNPPLIGSAAAAQLACEIAKQCPGASNGSGSGDCALPAGTVRMSRQGITVETQALGVWLLGSLRTGMAMVDAFLSVYGGAPRTKRTALLVPEMDPWPLRVE